jgi:hypothetical protein
VTTVFSLVNSNGASSEAGSERMRPEIKADERAKRN